MKRRKRDDADDFWRGVEKSAKSVKDLPSWMKVGIVVDRPKPKKRRRRVIDELRKQFPGEWSYDAGYGVWRHESGWNVQAYAQLAGTEDDFVTVYRRSDTDERIYIWVDVLG